MFILHKDNKTRLFFFALCTIKLISPNGLLKAIPHNDRLRALRAACLHIFGHLAQILLEIRQYSCVEFMQADEKSDCEIHMQSLWGVDLIDLIALRRPVLRTFVKKIKKFKKPLDIKKKK